MRLRTLFILSSFLVLSCKQNTGPEYGHSTSESDVRSAPLRVVFASCNDQERDQPLWAPILNEGADVFIWGGDNIYADTDQIDTMQQAYDRIYHHPEYARLRTSTRIMGTWDDHDYGLGDGGVEWKFKEEAKRLMLDFLDVPQDDVRWSRPGVYTAEVIRTEKGSVKVILLDTRSFRTGLKEGDVPGMRYSPWETGHQGTVLGETQWQWLEEELQDETHDFTLIVSSIQFLSDQHGWEKWANFPDEVQRMYQVLEAARSPNLIVLSGDRHMGEISVNRNWGKDYPLIDFTSSGLTHVYVKTGNFANPYRESNIIKRLNYGLLQFDFDKKEVTFQLKGRSGFTFEEFKQTY